MNDNNLFWKHYAGNAQTVLDPASRNIEVMFGIVMALSFTSAISITHGGHAQLFHFVWAIVGCNTAWGIIDGLTFIFSGIIERTRKERILKLIRSAGSKTKGITLAKQELQPLVAAIITQDQMEQLYDRLMSLPPLPKRSLFIGHELSGAFTIFLINFTATLPVALPFIFLEDPVQAKIVSDTISLTILFVCGYSTGKYAGIHPVYSGMSMILLGFCFLLVTQLLGG